MRDPIRGRSRWLLLLLGLIGCEDARIDEAALCFVSATEELVVQVSWSCASDHKGAELSCDVEVQDDGSLRVESVFIDGRDPNDACADPLVAQCTSPPLQDGTYQVHYGEDLFDITIPGVAEPTCDEI